MGCNCERSPWQPLPRSYDRGGMRGMRWPWRVRARSRPIRVEHNFLGIFPRHPMTGVHSPVDRPCGPESRSSDASTAHRVPDVHCVGPDARLDALARNVRARFGRHGARVSRLDVFIVEDGFIDNLQPDALNRCVRQLQRSAGSEDANEGEQEKPRCHTPTRPIESGFENPT